MYPLFETIAVENLQAPHLANHQLRMDSSYLALFHKHNPINLSDLFHHLNIPNEGLFKWRISYNQYQHKSEIALYQPRVVNRISFYHLPADFDYSLKYTERLMFETIKAKYPLVDDVVLVKNGLLTDSLISNLVIEMKNDSQLYTPSSPLLKGTHRKRLIESGKVVEREIRYDQLRDINSITFINAMCSFSSSPMLKINFC